MIKGIEVLVRKNLGNYEHEEVKLIGSIPDGVAFFEYAQYIKNMAHHYLALSANDQEVVAPVGKVEVAPAEHQVATPKVEEVKAEEAPKAKKARATKPQDKTEEGQEIPPVIPVEAEKVVEKKEKKASIRQTTVEFDNTVKDIRDRLASYLNNNYPNWKSTQKEVITSFLNDARGKPFEDLKGNMLDSFKDLVEATFGKK